MSAPALRWPNVERAVIGYLRLAANVLVYSETPPSSLPSRYLVVTRVGGRGGVLTDRTVDVEVLACTHGSRSDLWDLVADVESAMYALAAHAADGVYVDDVAETFGFADDPIDDQDVRRAVATFTLTVRPNRAA